MTEIKKDNPITSVVKEGGQTADATVDAAGKLATHTVKAVGKVGGEAGGLAKEAVMNASTIPHDVIKSAESGKPSK